MILVVRVVRVVMKKAKMDMKDLIITIGKNQRYRVYICMLLRILISYYRFYKMKTYKYQYF
jgi:hypothetical protein